MEKYKIEWSFDGAFCGTVYIYDYKIVAHSLMSKELVRRSLYDQIKKSVNYDFILED